MEKKKKYIVQQEKDDRGNKYFSYSGVIGAKTMWRMGPFATRVDANKAAKRVFEGAK